MSDADELMVRVDAVRCASTGGCAAAHPNLFRLHDDGTVEVLGPIHRKDLEDVRDAADLCPTEAIDYDE